MATGFEQLKDALGKGLPMDSPISELLEISKKLTSAYEDQLEHSTACMLPSHIYHLPTGYEEGYYLSVDLGGSTLRIGLVHLAGRKTPVPREDAINKLESGPMSVVDMRTWIGSDIDTLKTLKGDKFFDWIALRVGEVVESRFGKNNTQVLPLGLSWSFPIESTSIDSGKVQGMGKGFVVAEDLLGTDLKTHFTNAFTRLDVKVTLEAVINDSLAALLSHTYVAPDTRCALILGTGTNAAVSLPLSMLPESKLAQSNFTRPPDAQEVLVNTEVSMFGKGIFPVTEWDDALDAAMPRPGFQPLEYLVGGHYMGEIARRIIIGTSEKGCLFTTFPPLWKDPFTLSTEVLASMEKRFPSHTETYTTPCQTFRLRHRTRRR
ncbi:hypothetical protein DRE_04574 [Drechslerella stenobrocha 248]|uniref:Phosphotransferase n=1 Tax=Drechslerella stenobrocha 248 TaxID=1043628 RepID=W7HPX0_9PEZI|nr:hypothetical protein DRE_04574 [Drechslerella stenobrocha 248]